MVHCFSEIQQFTPSAVDIKQAMFPDGLVNSPLLPGWSKTPDIGVVATLDPSADVVLLDEEEEVAVVVAVVVVDVVVVSIVVVVVAAVLVVESSVEAVRLLPSVVDCSAVALVVLVESLAPLSPVPVQPETTSKAAAVNANKTVLPMSRNASAGLGAERGQLVL